MFGFRIANSLRKQKNVSLKKDNDFWMLHIKSHKKKMIKFNLKMSTKQERSFSKDILCANNNY